MTCFITNLATHSNADLLSKLPVEPAPTAVTEPSEHVLLMETLGTTLLTAKQIKDWSKRDPVMPEVIDSILHGWKSTDSPNLKAFRERREGLMVHNGRFLWGRRVVIPETGRPQAWDLIYEGHPGASRMKSLAQIFFE